MVKPDAEIYRHVIAKLACDPSEILFLDDNTINIDAAEAVGLDAHKVVGVAPALALLEQRGLMQSSPETHR